MAGNLSFEEFAASSPRRDPADRKKLLFIYRALEDLAAERRGRVSDLAILETACGAGAITLSLARTGARVRAFDTDAADVGALETAAARAGLDNVAATAGDASALRTDERYDVIVASEIEFAPDPDALLANVVRHLAPGGLVIVIASNGYGPWELTGASGRGSKPRHRRFTHGKLVALLQRNGLDVHRLMNAAFLSALAPAVRRSRAAHTFDAEFANLVPHWMASGWYVALRLRDAAGTNTPSRDPRRGARFAVWSALVLALAAPPVTAAAVTRHIWSAGFGDTLDQYMGSVALHPAGGIVAVGSFNGTIDLGGGPFTAGGFEDKIFIARFDATGAHLWSRSFAQVPLAFSPWVHAVATDPDGNVIVAGEFGDELNLGGATLSAIGTRSMFLAKFDANGAHVWSRRYGTSAVARSLATDAAGNIALGGDVTGIVDFGGGALVAQGASDVCVAVLNPDGSHRWSKRMGPLNNQFIGEVAMDRSGRVAVSGLFIASILTEGGTLTSAGESDVFVAVYDAAGGHLWSRGIGGTLADSGTDVAIDSLAGVVVTGVFRGTIDTGSGTLTAPATVGDGFLAAYSVAGAPRWSIQLGATASAIVEAIAAGEAGKLIIAGRFRPAMTLGTTTYPGPDGYIAVLDPDGVAQDVILTRSEGGSLALDADAQERVAFGATNRSLMNLGGDAIVSAGLQDVIVAELSTREAPPFPIVSFGVTAREMLVDVRWVVRHDLVGEFTLERWSGGGEDRRVVAAGQIFSNNGMYMDRDVQPRGVYTYILTVRGGLGEEFQSSPATAAVPSLETSLLQNAPNPFASSTEIAYRLDRAVDVVIGIYDVTGARIRLVDEGARGAGIHSATWDGRDQAGRPAASGVYFYRVENVAGAGSRKMMLVR